MSINKKNNNTKAILFISIAFVLIYSTIYIFINSYVIDGTRYFSLFDDEMVSMRYAENIAKGFGPVWNPNSEPVEGFSNPLWVYIMALIHLIGVEKNLTSLVIQVLAVILIIINIFIIKKIAELLSESNENIISFSILLSASYLPLLNWSLQGLEVSLITVLLSYTALLNLRSIRNGTSSLWQFIIPAIMILIRMDTILFTFAFLLYFYLFEKNKFKEYAFKQMIFTAITLILLFIWRNHYYGELLPNTYYLKMTGYPFYLRIAKGIYAFLKFSLYLTPFFLILPFWNYFKSKQSELLLILLPLVFMSFYSIYIGGDSWEWWMPSNRFIAATIPIFIIATLISINKYFKNYFITFSLLFLLSLNFNSWEYLKGELLLEKTFTEKDNRRHTELALKAKTILPHNATVAVTIAGTLPYFLERTCIDILGKNDKAIARMKALEPIPWRHYNPGHIKWNYSYSIGELKPDAVLQLWEKPQTAIPYLSLDYETYEIAGFNIFVRKK